MSGWIVAIDLGTSRSACAFSFTGQADTDIGIRVPEGCMPPVSGTKAETAVLLSTDDNTVLAFGRAARDRFIEESQDVEDAHGDIGPEVGSRPLHVQSNMHETEEPGHLEAHTASPAGSMLFRWFKMELCRKGGFTKVTDPVATAEGGQTLPLLTVMAAVLRHFKEDAIAYLSSAKHVTDNFVQNITWVVTIPAIYDDFARRFMRMAAHEAGLITTADSPRLRLCLEPEAACLAVSVKEAPDLSTPGTQTMILDCGGGTVDITTHEILSLGPLRLKELLLPTGGPWGSTYVDSEFTNWFRNFIGDDAYSMVRRTSIFYTLLRQWEEQKTRFGGKDNELVKLNMVEFAGPLGYSNANIQELRVAHNERHSEAPDLHVAGRNFIVKLPSSLVRTFFAPVINKISDCLDDLKRNPSLTDLKYVFMVGGFSSSPLLQAAARATFDEEGRRRVIVALRPDVAIVKGAVLCADNVEAFTTRKARLTYGVESLGLYDSSDPEHVKRRPKYPFVDEGNNERILIFSQHLKAGDDVPLHNSCPKRRYRPMTRHQDVVTIKILASHMKDVGFPDKTTTFPLGEVTVPMDMNIDFDDRGVDVEFVFGGTEFTVHCLSATTGADVGNVRLEFMQEAVKSG